MHVKILTLSASCRKGLICLVILQAFSLSLFAQSTQISGRVVGSDKESMPGANILIKGTSTGTVTDADGKFRIEAPSSDAIIVISAIGFTSQEIRVGDRSVIDITLETDITELAEVVVVGYGAVKKTDITGALVSVSAATITERPSANVLQALQGKVSGMNVSSNVKPGEVPSVTIRGNRSIQAGNGPLYVVDGIPLTSGSIADFNSNDIASVEVLKDASATAIYGSRGANGVILITTKKGTNGKFTINYNATVSLDSYKQLTDWMTAGEYVDQWRLGLMNGGLYSTSKFTNLNTPVVPGYPDPAQDVIRMGLATDPVAQKNVLSGYEWVDDVIGGTVKTRATTAEEQANGWPAQVPIYNSENVKGFNWRDAVLRTGVTNNHQISLGAGTEKSHLYMSLTYFDQLGVQKDQDYTRYNGLISGDISPSKWLTLGTSMNFSSSVQNFGVNSNVSGNTGSKDLFSRANDQFPFAQPYNDAGVAIRNPGGNLNIWNPIIDIDQAINERRVASVITNLFTEIKFTSWLKYRLNFGVQYRNLRTGAWTGPDATSHLTNRPNTASYATSQNMSYVAENLLYFDKTIDRHTFGATLLQSVQKNRNEGISTSVQNTIYPTSLWYDLASNTVGNPLSYGTSFSENSLMSYMARVNYSFNSRYLFTATGRYDGASVLAPGHKWDFFPSAAVAWKIHEESFLSGVSWINETKLRVSYGVVGNSSVGAYQTSGPLSRNPYVFGAVPAIGYLPQVPANPDLGWEKTGTWNVGLDYGLFNSRLRGSIEAYQSITSDLLLDKTLPAVSGYVSKTQNIGKTSNTGVEVTISGTVLEKTNFSWDVDVNWSTNKEKILELINGEQDMLAQRYFIGQPISVYYQLKDAGIWQNTEEDKAEMAKFNANGTRFYPGTVRVEDMNGDYKINAEDYVIRGTNRPKWIGGITNTFRYKNWTLSSFIYAKVGQTYFGGYPNYGYTTPNGRAEKDMYSPTNPGGRFPQPNLGAVDNISAAMQFNNGTFFAVRNISLGFAFPNDILSKIHLSNLQLNVQVLNPFIFGGDIVKLGLNPDDNTNWDNQSLANSNTAAPLGGTNANTILQQSLVFGIKASF
jgi:TonB-linked SusC/RagA family outer membrane protein